MNWDDLAGVHILEANYDGKNLNMTLKNGENVVKMTWQPEGDCCSLSWIEHIEGVENLAGQTVLEAFTDEGERDDAHPEYDCLQIYFYKLRTTGGYLDIDMRNSSNGYYGGWLTCSSSIRSEDIIRYITPDVINNYKH